MQLTDTGLAGQAGEYAAKRVETEQNIAIGAVYTQILETKVKTVQGRQ